MVILSYLIIRALGFIRIPTVVAKVIGDGLFADFQLSGAAAPRV